LSLAPSAESHNHSALRHSLAGTGENQELEQKGGLGANCVEKLCLKDAPVIDSLFLRAGDSGR
jgi:hypothetical protein